MKNIIYNDEGGVVYGVGGVHRPKYGMGVIFSFFSGASMTDYVFCYMNDGRLDAFYQLGFNSEINRYYLNEDDISEEVYNDYMSTFSSEPMEVIPFR